MKSWRTIATVAGLIAVVAALAAYSLSPETIQPERSAATEQSTATNPSPALQQHATIASSVILKVQIPAVSIDAKASGETWPRESSRCHATTLCIDPPSLREVAWYGAYAVPSLPSSDSVLIFGHSNYQSREEQVFNNLPAVLAGDQVVVSTQTGVFTYIAQQPHRVPYHDVPTSEIIYAHVPNRVVLVTCGDSGDSAIVVVADLASATTR